MKKAHSSPEISRFAQVALFHPKVKNLRVGSEIPKNRFRDNSVLNRAFSLILFCWIGFCILYPKTPEFSTGGRFSGVRRKVYHPRFAILREMLRRSGEKPSAGRKFWCFRVEDAKSDQTKKMNEKALFSSEIS